MNAKLRRLAITAAALGLVAAFANCAPGFFSAPKPLSRNHPVEFSKVEAPSQAPVMGHRGYASSVLKEVFSDPTDLAHTNSIHTIVDQWITSKMTIFGLACNQYGTALGADCEGEPANINGQMQKPSDVVRQSMRIRACEEILGIDRAVTVALSKVSVDAATAPKFKQILSASTLFFRGDAPSDVVISSFVQLSTELGALGEPAGEQWRAILIELCQMPEWELL